MNTITPLAANCNARNRVNSKVNLIFPLLVAVLKPFVGTKVLKRDNTITEKVKAVLESILPKWEQATVPGSFRCYQSLSEYSLAYNIRTEILIETDAFHSRCFSADHYMYLGNVRDGILVELSDPEKHANLKADYNPDIVQGLRDAAEKAEKAYRDADSACVPFGRHDR